MSKTLHPKVLCDCDILRYSFRELGFQQDPAPCKNHPQAAGRGETCSNKDIYVAFLYLEKIKTPLSQGRKNSTISTTASSGRNCRQLPDLANKGLKMALASVCPHFMREKGLAKDSKCGKLFEAMCVGILDERLIRFLWLFYELSGEVQDPKLFSRNPV